MPTSDERREAAARLRGCARDVNGTCDLGMHLSHWVGAGGEGGGDQFSVAADRRLAERTLGRLADLMDPTCEVVPFDEESMRLPHCSRCGQPMLKPWPSFCPNCGSRVTTGGDAE
jgi:hypothetical protein